MATTYCDVSDVANFLRISIDGTTNPNQSMVETIINRKEDIIDQRTGHAWRTATKSSEEHDLGMVYTYGWGTPIFLQHRNIRTIDSASGDKLELWNGDSFLDVTTDTTNYRLDFVRGKIYLKGMLFTIMRKSRFRITYRYGDTVVPGDIKDACIKMTAIDLLSSSFKMDTIPMGAKGIDAQTSSDRWRQDVEVLLKNREEVMII